NHLVDQLRTLTKDSQRAVEIATLYDQLDSEWKLLTLQIHQALNQQKQELAVQLPSLSKPFLFNPWGNPLQIPPGFPTIDQVRSLAAHELQNIPEAFIQESIPPLYRLAEYLGIGKNSISAEAFYLDPHLFYGEFHSHEIQARVRQHIFGNFQIKETESVLETFRRSLETQGFVSAIDIRISNEVKPHHFSLREIPLLVSYIHNGHSEWNSGRMKDRFPLHSVAIAVPASKLDQQEKTADQVRQLLENRFSELRVTMTENVESEILPSKLFRQFNKHLIKFHKLESIIHKEESAIAPCLWDPKNSNSTDYIREQIAHFGSQETENQPATLLPEGIRLSAIHALRHAAPLSKSQLAAEVAWLARLLIIEMSHD
ncbi:hypothetical protein N8487_00135, partial [bacterium]|nr:hypothetical protein [bacterium]